MEYVKICRHVKKDMEISLALLSNAIILAKAYFKQNFPIFTRIGNCFLSKIFVFY